MVEKIRGVYRITHVDKPGFVYIGSSVNCNLRRHQHLSDLRNGKHRNIRLQRVCDKYGLDGFYFEIVPFGGEIRKEEQKMLDDFVNVNGRERLWNLSMNTVCPFDDPVVWEKAMVSILENEKDADFVSKRNAASKLILERLNADPEFRKASSDRIKKLNSDPDFVSKRDLNGAVARADQAYKDRMYKKNSAWMKSLWKQDWFYEKKRKAASILGANKEIRRTYLNKVRKPVICFSTNEKFKSILDAATWVVSQGLSKSINSVEGGIRMCCNGKSTHSYGFSWGWCDNLTKP